MEQIWPHPPLEIVRIRASMQAVSMEAHPSIAYFNFIVRQTPYSQEECFNFCFPQANLLEEFRRLSIISAMLSRFGIWGRIVDPDSFVNLQYALSGFFHPIIHQRNGLGVGFYIHLFLHTARISQEQRSSTHTIRPQMIDEGPVFLVSDDNEEAEETDREQQGLETVIANLERVDAVGAVVEGSCSICLEEFEKTIDTMDLGRTSCSHMFHYDCIAQWLKRSPKCPLCRCEIR